MIFEIFQLRGTPTEETWSGVSLLKDYKDNFPQFKKQSLKQRVTKGGGKVSEAGMDLMERMLEMDPVKRIGIQDALKHPYFNE